MNPLVSVIIPAYRAAELIEEAIASVATQTYQHWEVVVVEDGTDDGTAALLARIASEKGWSVERLRYYRHPQNKGLSATRNTAIQLAKGKYIALLDHDDLWQPNHLSAALSAIARYSADLVYTQAAFFAGETGCYRHLGICGPTASDLQNFPGSLLRKNFIPVCSVVMKKSVWTAVGGFDTQLQRAEDLDFWLRAIEAKFAFAHVPKVTGGYRQNTPTAMTANKAEILEWHARVLCKNRKMIAVPKTLKEAEVARACFGVARRSRKTNWRKAWQFLLYPWWFSPRGAVTAIAQSLKEQLLSIKAPIVAP